MTGWLLWSQLAAFPLTFVVWRYEGSPRPFRRWLLVVMFNERAVRELEKR